MLRLEIQKSQRMKEKAKKKHTFFTVKVDFKPFELLEAVFAFVSEPFLVKQQATRLRAGAEESRAHRARVTESAVGTRFDTHYIGASAGLDSDAVGDC